jgi:hypothetical protein
MQDRISSITLIALIAVGVVLFVLSMMDSYDPILYGSYVYFGIGVVVALLGAVAGMVINPAGIKQMAIGTGVVALVLAISWGLADGSDYVNYTAWEISEGMSQFSGMLLYAIYIFSGLAVLSVGFSWVHKLTR